MPIETIVDRMKRLQAELTRARDASEEIRRDAERRTTSGLHPESRREESAIPRHTRRRIRR